MPGDQPQLIVISVASHGRQPLDTELPAILASDAVSPKSDTGSVDLDSQICRPLDSVTGRKLKVLLVIDTCRENERIGTWTGNAETRLKRLHWSSKTDFQIVLACDKGRLASEEQSLTGALIRELQSSNKDLDTICRAAQAQIDEQSSGKQRPPIHSRGSFSDIHLSGKVVKPASSICLDLGQCQKLLLAAGMLAAVDVLLFWALLQRVDMACTNITHEQRHLACPATSCFCTDCDPSNMLLNMFLSRFGGATEDSVPPHVSNRSAMFLTRYSAVDEDAVSPRVFNRTAITLFCEFPVAGSLFT
ncbi:unnamed protein product [Symbiodinium sp. CCMP2456]|nr:unnamed protein product [Symbiodinium sp. CCMP2456]